MDEIIGIFMILVGFTVAAGIYLIPTYIAFRKNHPNAVAIAALNILLGWRFIGCVAALNGALSKE